MKSNTSLKFTLSLMVVALASGERVRNGHAAPANASGSQPAADLASESPMDAGLAGHQAVVFVDDFEGWDANTGQPTGGK